VPAEPHEILVFEVGGQRYGLPIADVRELVRAVAIVPLPRAPAVIEGVINYRGKVIPVFDIRRRFGLPARPLALADHFVVARAGERLTALRVDRALDLVMVEAADLQEARGVVPGAEYVSWVAKLPQDLVLIHDLRTFLSRADGQALDKAMVQAEQETIA
jgi:purine-binding chemotaxis protein CheW